LKLEKDWKFLNADVISTYPVYLKYVEPVQQHVNKCGRRIIPELNGIILLKIYHFEPEGTWREEDDSKWLIY